MLAGARRRRAGLLLCVGASSRKQRTMSGKEEASRVAAVCWGIIEEAADDVREGGGHIKEGGNGSLKNGGGVSWPNSGDFDHLTSRQCRRSRRSSSGAIEV
jgi:hypothetical protein